VKPATLRALAIQAAGRGEWIKAADLQCQAVDLETAAHYGRDPYNAAPVSRPAPPVYVRPDRDPCAMTTDQLNEAERLLAGSRLSLEP
jgi:hypothetical protein